MTTVKQKRYSPAELQEFEAIIQEKLKKSQEELKITLESLGGKNSNSVAPPNIKSLEDSSESMEREDLGLLAARQQQYLDHLEAALVRIKNGTYGLCVVTGKLIEKERLKAVPNTRHSLAAKLALQKNR